MKNWLVIDLYGVRMEQPRLVSLLNEDLLTITLDIYLLPFVFIIDRVILYLIWKESSDDGSS
jgi:hypothetical protein